MRPETPFHPAFNHGEPPMHDFANQPTLDFGDHSPGQGQAQLTNMALCLKTLIDCRESDNPSARMGIFHGFSGYGKTVAAAFSAARTGAAYIQAQELWTRKTLLDVLAAELGIARPKRVAADLLRQIIEQLNRQPVDLIVDEMDYLANKGLVNTLRDIHDGTNIAILMIGEEALPAKLKAWERFDNRIVSTTAALPASQDDAIKLRDHYCHRIRIADDLTELFRVRCRGVTRRIVNNLQHAQKLAAEEGADHVDVAWWGDRPVRTGDVITRKAA